MSKRMKGLILACMLATVGLAWYLVTPLPHHAPSRGRLSLHSETIHRKLFGARVRRMLAAHQYDRLESLADSLIRKRPRFPSGMPLIATFFVRGCGEVDDDRDPDQWVQLLDDLRQWVEARPQSATARIALVDGLVGHGEAARGDEYAAKVPEARMDQYRRDLEDAHMMLCQSRPDRKTRSERYAAELEVLHGLGFEADSSYRATAWSAMSEYPEDLRWYLDMATHLLPRWYGNPGDWETFADTCASMLPDSSRDEIYARIVEDQNHYVPNVFKESRGLSWPRIRRGLGLWTRHCPASLQPQSALAMLAGESERRAEALEAFAAIGDSVEVDIWRDWQTYWLAREWAYSVDRLR